jgi:hypothetical protein
MQNDLKIKHLKLQRIERIGWRIKNRWRFYSCNS